MGSAAFMQISNMTSGASIFLSGERRHLAPHPLMARDLRLLTRVHHHGAASQASRGWGGEEGLREGATLVYGVCVAAWSYAAGVSLCSVVCVRERLKVRLWWCGQGCVGCGVPAPCVCVCCVLLYVKVCLFCSAGVCCLRAAEWCELD